MKKFFWIFLLVLSVSSSLFLTSCNDDDDDDNDVINAKVMVVHASPDAPGVDILVDDTKVNTAPLTFPNNSAYLDVTAGVRNVKVNVAGATPAVTVLDFATQWLISNQFSTPMTFLHQHRAKPMLGLFT